MGSIEVIGIGALNVDHIYRVERIVTDGESVVDEASLFPGGSAANTIYGLARLGMRAGFIGVTGGDAEGRLLLDDFRDAGVDTSRIRVVPAASSGAVICLSDREGRRSLYVNPGANDLFTQGDLDPAYLRQARFVHVSSFVGEAQFPLLTALAEELSGAPVKLSFSPGVLYTRKGLAALRPILEHTHALFVNRDEICELTGADIENGAEICLAQGCRVVIVTLGKGLKIGNTEAVAYIRDEEKAYLIAPAPDTWTARDTTGAGDAFSTGFLYGLLGGKGHETCGRLGELTAGFSIRRVGARPGLPTASELAAGYRERYQEPL